MAGAEQTCIKCALDRCEKGTDFSTLSNTDLSVPWVPTTSPQCWVLGRSQVVCQEAPEGAHRLRAWKTGGPQGAAGASEPEGDGTHGPLGFLSSLGVSHEPSRPLRARGAHLCGPHSPMLPVEAGAAATASPPTASAPPAETVPSS